MDWLQQLYDLFGTTYEYPYTDYQQINLDFVFSALAVLKEAVVSLQQSVTRARLQLVADVVSTEIATEFDTPLSIPCQELYLQIAVPGDTDAVISVKARSGEFDVVSLNINRLIASSDRFWFCHMIALSPYPVAEYGNPQPLTESTTVVYSYLTHFVLDDTSDFRAFDNVQVSVNSGAGVFRAGTKIRIYGR